MSTATETRPPIEHLRDALELLHLGGGHRHTNNPADCELIDLGYAETFLRSYRTPGGVTKISTMIRCTKAGTEMIKDRPIFTEVRL